MKTRVQRLLYVILTLGLIFFLLLWKKEKGNYEDLVRVFKYSVENSLEEFKNYKENENMSTYYEAVSYFKVIDSSATFMPEDSIQYQNLLLLKFMHSMMVSNPDKTKENIDLIIEILTLLHEDENNPNAYLKMFNYRNAIEFKGV